MAYERTIRLSGASRMDYRTYQDNDPLIDKAGLQPYPVFDVRGHPKFKKIDPFDEEGRRRRSAEPRPPFALRGNGGRSLAVEITVRVLGITGTLVAVAILLVLMVVVGRNLVDSASGETPTVKTGADRAYDEMKHDGDMEDPKSVMRDALKGDL